jgi:ABC-2 type transport system permease protein
MMFVFDAVVVAVGYGFGFHVHWLGLLVLGVLLALLAGLMAAFSVATALVTKDISSFAAIINGLNLPLLLLAGVLLPISLGPLWMRVLGSNHREMGCGRRWRGRRSRRQPPVGCMRFGRDR